ncbi:MAG: imidazole glycerol phosphate synthase subunit HisH [Desulfomonilaceae bacterium]|jgi:glutamine amidotransferase
MTSEVTVVDYGLGNLFSVGRALERCGAMVTISDNPLVISKAPRLVLPGVGAFANGMLGLIERRLDTVIRDYTASGRPLLGICLGMQLMATMGEEFGQHDGLNIIPGRVIAIPKVGTNGLPHKIPHIGWAALEIPPERIDWEGTILANTSLADSVYLVHSYQLLPDDNNHRLADCRYNGLKISAAVQFNNVVGLQFHPEKSGRVGLNILDLFLKT